jgi:guanine deaminase
VLSNEPDLEFARLALRMARPSHEPRLPFGAVITYDGQLEIAASNEVLSSSDPTAHAEIVAIRKLVTQRTDLSSCALYASCEPCIMCAAAIARSGIPTVWYAASRKLAQGYGFADVVASRLARRVLPNARRIAGLSADEVAAPFRLWEATQVGLS